MPPEHPESFLLPTMLFWWVTLCTSVKPLMYLLTRVLYAGTILYLTQDNTAMKQQQQKEQLYANNVVTMLDNQEFTTATTTTTKSASTDYWSLHGWDASTEWKHDMSFFSDSMFASVEDMVVNTPSSSITSLSLIEGIYKYEKSFNFNKYLKELGVSYMLRTFAGMATPIVTITKSRPEVNKYTELMYAWFVHCCHRAKFTLLTFFFFLLNYGGSHSMYVVAQMSHYTTCQSTDRGTVHAFYKRN